MSKLNISSGHMLKSCSIETGRHITNVREDFIDSNKDDIHAMENSNISGMKRIGSLGICRLQKAKKTRCTLSQTQDRGPFSGLMKDTNRTDDSAGNTEVERLNGVSHVYSDGNGNNKNGIESAPFLPSSNCNGELWKVTEKCRIMYEDTTLAFGPDHGLDNLHNTRNAQSTFCQEAYRSDRGYPADYTPGNKRLTSEARDLIVCVMCRVATQLAAMRQVPPCRDNTKSPRSNSADPLDPRECAVFGVGIQLFDRFMAIVQQYDAEVGTYGESRSHPLRGIEGRKGLNPLLLNQLIAIACLCFAERFDAMMMLDYRHVVSVWRQQVAGMLRSAWPSRQTFDFKMNLLHLERVILAYVSPCGQLSLPPTSELTESLMNAAYLFATSRIRKMRMVESSSESGDATSSNSDDPFTILSLESGEEGCFSIRVSGSSRVDIPRQVAQLLVRLAELDRTICLRFRPSTIAAAAAQLAVFPTGVSVASLPPKDAKDVEAAFAAAAAALTASGGSSSCKLVRQCQLLLIQKWIKVKNAILTKSEDGGSLPDRLLAVWVQENLAEPHHRRVLLALQQHANGLLRCAAMARRQNARCVLETKGMATKIAGKGMNMFTTQGQSGSAIKSKEGLVHYMKNIGHQDHTISGPLNVSKVVSR